MAGKWNTAAKGAFLKAMRDRWPRIFQGATGDESGDLIRDWMELERFDIQEVLRALRKWARDSQKYPKIAQIVMRLRVERTGRDPELDRRDNWPDPDVQAARAAVSEYRRRCAK